MAGESRTELIAWLGDLLAVNYNKVREKKSHDRPPARASLSSTCWQRPQKLTSVRVVLCGNLLGSD
jgi:hypothetical protein